MSPKKIGFFIIIVVSLFIINNLVQSIYTLWQKKNLVVDARLDVDKHKYENQVLKNKLKSIESSEFIEEEARNKLFLVKPGEQIVVFSEKNLEATISSKIKPKDTRPNWKKWYDLFI